MGGGLVMIGGRAHLRGRRVARVGKLEKELPVDMEIPAQRQMPKGALVLIMHSCEFAAGQLLGRAVRPQGDRDPLGPGRDRRHQLRVERPAAGGGGGARWEFALAEKGDGTAVNAAVKNMPWATCPSFDDAMNVALNGKPGQPGLAKSNARQKHVIIISDGDPGARQPKLIERLHAGTRSPARPSPSSPHGDPNVPAVDGRHRQRDLQASPTARSTTTSTSCRRSSSRKRRSSAGASSTRTNNGIRLRFQPAPANW